ncbi:MAG: multicopper polyphenol oxidase, partial [Paenibacillus sp. RIFOXYA1_FULL_44_5]
NQVHGNEIAVITENDMGKGRTDAEDAVQGKDGLITNRKGIWLTAFFADCVPLYFFDPVNEAVGIAHAGWKGTVLNIARNTAQAMQKQFDSKPEHILAAIGPSIQSCCYEVDNHVIQQVDKLLEEHAITDSSPYYIRKNQEKYMLDLQQLNKQNMIKAGILPMNIEISEWCTSCSTTMFFSHRKEAGKTGRMAAWIGLHLLD